MNAKLKGFILTRDRRVIKKIQVVMGHEVWNDTDGLRVVLFMDVLRPLPYLGGLLNRTIIKAIAASPFMRDAKRNHEGWERRISALWN